MVHRRWILALLFALMTVPAASSRVDPDPRELPLWESATSAVPTLGTPAAPALGGLDLAVVDPLGDLCTPALVLERQWYGAVPTDWRHIEAQALAPIQVVGQLTRFVPSLGNLLLPGSVLLVPITETVKGVADIAVHAAWNEEYLTWSTFTDELVIGGGAPDIESLTQAVALEFPEWQVKEAALQCGDDRQGVGYHRDPASRGVHVSCLDCLAQPANGWVLQNIAALDVWLAKAKDYDQLPPMSASFGPGEVVEAAKDRVNDLEPTIEDVLRQQAARVEAGLPRIL